MPVRFAQSKHIFGWVILVSLMFGMLAPAASDLALAQYDEDPNYTYNPTGTTQSTSSSAPSAAKSEANTTKEAASSSSGGVTESCIGGPVQLVKCAGTGLLRAFTWAFAWLANYAAALFIWVVNPANVSGPSGIMNAQAVYEMWKFVRDFFNLFFILILLLSAFATVFQVENFSIRKIFLNILIAALIINFSFPITRFLIDLTNVPMYYFLNAILPGQPGGEGFAKIFLASTGFGAIPMAADGAFTKAFFDVVFTFLLAISLLVLGVMFLIRLIALTLLLIFSPFGFAAALMPGFQKLGQEWWGKFWSYAFFGPAAALVLLVAIRFMESVSLGGVYLNLKKTTTDVTAGGPEANSMAAMIYYLIPLILIWTAIGMANRFSIAGASKVVGWGESFSRWTAKKAGKGMLWAGTHNPIANTVKGLGSGIKDRAMDSKAAKWIKSPSSFESGAKGFAKGKGWAAGVKGEKEKYHQNQVKEKVKKNKDEQASRSALRKDLDSADAVVRQAAAISLAEAGEIRTAQDLKQAIVGLRSSGTPDQPKFDQFASDMVLKAIDKAKDGATSGIDPKLYDHIVQSAGGYQRDSQGKLELDPATGEKIVGPTLEALDGKLKKDGNIHVKVDYQIQEEINESIGKGAPIPQSVARDKVYDKVVATMNAEDLVKQTDLHRQTGFNDYFRQKLANNPKRTQAVLDKAMEKGKPPVQASWAAIAKQEKSPEEVQDEEAKQQAEAIKTQREKMKARKAETRANRVG